jgi:hypothetical protein
MSARRERRRARARRHPNPAPRSPPVRQVELHEASSVERLAYSRKQAAEALGVSIATIDRRVVPAIETVKTPWGQRLIPVDELKRFLRQHTESGRRPPLTVRPAGHRRSPSQSSTASGWSTRAAEASARSPGHSQPTACRPPTADGAGGPQRCERSCSAISLAPGPKVSQSPEPALVARRVPRNRAIALEYWCASSRHSVAYPRSEQALPHRPFGRARLTGG